MRDEERARLREWHTKAHQMQVAHIKEAERCGNRGRGLAVVAAILATFTGATWITDLSAAGAPNDVLRWLSAIAGLGSGVLVAFNTAMAYLRRAADHQAGSVRYGKVRHAIEAWRVEHPAQDHPSHAIIETWMGMWAEAEETAVVVDRRVLGRAKKYVRNARWDVW